MKHSRNIFGAVWLILTAILIAHIFGGCMASEAKLYEAAEKRDNRDTTTVRPLPLGHYEGVAQLGGEPLYVYIDGQTDQTLTLSIPMGGLESLPLKVTRQGRNYIETSLLVGLQEMRLRLRPEGEGWIGTLLIGGETATITFHPGRWSRELMIEQNRDRKGEPIQVEGRYGELGGTLLIPAGEPPFPALLLIAGSGPTDRDGNSEIVAGRSDMLLKIAEYLQKLGYASVRYDKLGVGESRTRIEFDPSVYTFEDAITDAQAVLDTMFQDPRLVPTGAVGHSEGSLIALVLGTRNDDLAWIVSLAGNGDSIDEQLVKQIARQDPAAGRQLSSDLIRIAAGEEPEVSSPMTAALLKAENIAYIRSWMNYHPLEIISGLKKPVLAVWGTADERIVLEDSLIGADSLPYVHFREISGMSHLLKQTGGSVQLIKRSHYDPDMELDPQLLSVLAEFLQNFSSSHNHKANSKNTR